MSEDPGRPHVTWATCDDGQVADDGHVADNPSDRAVATPDEQAGEVTGGAAAVGSGQVGGSVKADEGGAPQAPAGQGGGGSARGRAGMRDMLLSMVVLAVAVLVLAAVSRGCSFSPGGASDDSTSLPPVDVTAELQAAVGQVHFPLRQPTLPTGWHANSDSVASVGPQGADQTVQVGWIAPGGQFLQLSQSNGTVLDLVRKAAGLADGTPVSQTGTQTVDGTKWTVYPGVRTEQSWAADLGPVRLLITGNGSTDQFRTLATATRSGAIVR
jgi:hypothetical protein